MSTGVLPRPVLLPGSVRPRVQLSAPVAPTGVHLDLDTLVFFGVSSADDLTARMDRVKAGNGTILAGPFDADGAVVLARDPFGAHFALFDRSDPPDATKPGTALRD